MSSTKSGCWVTPPSASKKKNSQVLRTSSSTESRHDNSRTPTAEESEAPATETNLFSVLREKAPSSSNNPLEAKGISIRGRKPEDPTYPVETARASPLPGHQDPMSSPPNPEKEEGEMTSSNTNIPHSIARALLDALQEKRTGKDLPPTIISIACVRASQLQQYLVTGREPSEGTNQATLDLISLGQGPSGLTHLADKVSTVSHTLEYTSNPPSNCSRVNRRAVFSLWRLSSCRRQCKLEALNH